MEKTAVTAADFRLFLCHLYFSDYYCYPPVLPKNNIALDAGCLSSLCFPSFASLDWAVSATPVRLTDTEPATPVTNEALLTLAHYLDCQAMMRQCEAILLTQVVEGERKKDSAAWRLWLVEKSLHWLQYSDRYNMQQVKKLYISVIVHADDIMKQNQYWEARKQWDKVLVLEIMEELMRAHQSLKVQANKRQRR